MNPINKRDKNEVDNKAEQNMEEDVPRCSKRLKDFFLSSTDAIVCIDPLNDTKLKRQVNYFFQRGGPTSLSTLHNEHFSTHMQGDIKKIPKDLTLTLFLKFVSH